MFPPGLNVLLVLLYLAQIYFVNIIIKNGTILKSNYYRLITISFAIIILGALARVLDYAFSSYLLIGGSVLLLISYLRWAVIKKPFYPLDLLKILWVFTVVGSSLQRYIYLPFQAEMIIAENVIFIFMVVVYYKYPYQRHSAEPGEKDSDDIPIDQV